MNPSRDDATPALDRATVEALEGAARAAEEVNNDDCWDWCGDCPKTDAFLNAARPSFILQLIADWKILAGQNEMAYNANRDLGASNDELLLRVCRLEKALREIARFDDAAANDRLTKDGSFSSFDEPHSVQIARTALEGSERRG